MIRIISTAAMAKTTVAFSLTIFSLLAHSGEADEHEHHGGHDAHIHGEANLFIVLENNKLQVEFESPAFNLVGFEHEISKDAERHRVNDAMAVLKQPNQLMGWLGGQCHNTMASVETSLEEHDSHEHHDHDAHDGHSENEEEHHEFSSSYQFVCAQPDRLKGIDVKYFEKFQGVEVLEVQWIIRGNQGASLLKPGKSRVEF